VIVPGVNSAAEVARAVAACRYPPAGERSFGPTRAALQITGYSPEAADAATLCFPMIETRAAFDDLAAIAATPGIDGLFVGPRDLALSHGETNSPSSLDPAQRARIVAVAEACREAGLVAAIYCGGGAIAADWIGAGFRLLAVDADVAWLGKAAAAELAAVRPGGRA
jgi:4-hydroxy-2-oxoheptanedioate aldolase